MWGAIKAVAELLALAWQGWQTFQRRQREKAKQAAKRAIASNPLAGARARWGMQRGKDAAEKTDDTETGAK